MGLLWMLLVLRQSPVSSQELLWESYLGQILVVFTTKWYGWLYSGVCDYSGAVAASSEFLCHEYWWSEVYTLLQKRSCTLVSIAMSSLINWIYVEPFLNNENIRPTVWCSYAAKLSQPLNQGAHIEIAYGGWSPLCTDFQAEKDYCNTAITGGLVSLF